MECSFCGSTTNIIQSNITAKCICFECVKTSKTLLNQEEGKALFDAEPRKVIPLQFT